MKKDVILALEEAMEKEKIENEIEERKIKKYLNDKIKILHQITEDFFVLNLITLKEFQESFLKEAKDFIKDFIENTINVNYEEELYKELSDLDLLLDQKFISDKEKIYFEHKVKYFLNFLENEVEELIFEDLNI